MQKNYTVDTESITFTFLDLDGDQFAWFKLNPMDPRMEQKCKSMAEVFADASKTVKSPMEWEEFVEIKFCEFLGYDCRRTLFGRIAATDVMKDGRSFASHVLDVMIAHVGQEIQRRRQERVNKYTAKYAK